MSFITKKIGFGLLFGFCFMLVVSQPKFEDKAIEKGLTANYGFSNEGGGISFYDFNNDGLDDVTITSEASKPVQFYQNNNGTFSEVTFNFVDGNFRTKQVNWVDYDNDGDKDLMVTSDTGLNKLYNNDGNMNFTDVSIFAGFYGVNGLTTGSSWGDYNNDGYLDLFLTRFDYDYIKTNALYRNNGDGSFTDVSTTSGIGNVSALSFCSAFFDFNNDGWLDIYIINDRVGNSNILYKNNQDGTFTDVSVSSGTGVFMDAMSTTIEDFNNDGWLDIYITNTTSILSDPIGNALLINNGDETFTNMATQVGVTFDSYGWGAIFLDADLDTYNDIYVSGYFTGVQTELPSAFYHNQGDDTCIIPDNIGLDNDTRVSHSNALGDYNNDGKPDIVVMNHSANVFLWENQAVTENNYLKVNLEGTQSNRDGIGSRIEISSNGKVQHRATLCGEGYLGQNSHTEFFGVGNSTNIDYVKVTWLSGVVDILNDVNPNQTITIIEGVGLSVDDVAENRFNIYPNPNKGVFNIKSNLNQDYALVIFDVFGRQVYTNNYTNSLNQVDVRNLSQGVYFINVSSDGKEFTQKIVID